LGLPQSWSGSGHLACDNYHILRDTVLKTDAVWVSSPLLVEQELATGQLAVLKIRDSNMVQATNVCAVHRSGFSLSSPAYKVLNYLQGFLSSTSR